MTAILGLEGKRIRLFLRGTGFRYTGIVLIETPTFLTLDDEKDGREHAFNKEEISSLEVLEERA